MMNKNLEAARQLVKLARQLVAKEEYFIVFDEEEGAKEVSKSEFSNLFENCLDKTAAYSPVKLKKKQTKVTFYVSPCVNAVSDDKNSGIMEKLELYLGISSKQFLTELVIKEKSIVQLNRMKTKKEERIKSPLI